jgi:hypothetical protein
VITNRKALEHLLVTRKPNLIASQIYDSELRRIDYRGVARTLFTAGFRKGDPGRPWTAR